MAPKTPVISEERENGPKWPKFIRDAVVLQTKNGQFLDVFFSNGQKSRFPSVWLKDNEPIASNFADSKNSKVRNRHFKHLDVEIKITDSDIKGDQIQVTWSDGTSAIFTGDWLLNRDFTRARDERARVLQLYFDIPSIAKLWTRKDLEKTEVPQGFNFDEVTTDDSILLDALTSLLHNGLLFIKNAPPEVGTLEKLSKVLGHAKNTHLGMFYQLIGKADAAHIGQMPVEVGYHTDHAQTREPSDVVALHCVQQAQEGGQSNFSDGFEVARQIRENHPEDFKILCETELEYVGWGTDEYKFHFVNRAPIFKFNEKLGRVEQLSFEDDRRNWFINAEVDKVPRIFKAMKTFMDCCYDPKNLYRTRLVPGEIVLFLNKRMVHGREAYATSEAMEECTERLLENCHFTLDVITSKIRVLQETLAKEVPFDHLI